VDSSPLRRAIRAINEQGEGRIPATRPAHARLGRGLLPVGEVHFSVGQQSFTASAGDFVYAPGSVPHGFCGASEQPARVLIFDAPAHAGIFFKRVSREVKDLPRDLPKVMDIAEATGIRFLKPIQSMPIALDAPMDW